MKKVFKDFNKAKKQNNKEYKVRLKALIKDDKQRVESYVEDFDFGVSHKIEVNIAYPREEVYSKYSTDLELSPDIYAYIEDKMSHTRPYRMVDIIYVVDDSYTKEELKKIKSDYFKRYYIDFTEKTHKRRMNRIIALILLLIGLLLLSVYVLFSTVYKGHDVASELFCIFAWVFVWESVDFFFFRSTELKYEALASSKYSIAKIYFKNIKTGEFINVDEE